MGFFAKLFGSVIDCEACGDRRAQASFGGTKCPNPNCVNYDRVYAQSAQAGSMAGGARQRGGPAPWAAQPSVQFANPIEVHYRNFEGESKTFTADRDSVRVRNAHISLCVAPTGTRIALKRDRISTPGLVEQVIEAQKSGPTPHEQYVMDYHARRGTTSALCDQLRAKYGSQ